MNRYSITKTMYRCGAFSDAISEEVIQGNTEDKARLREALFGHGELGKAEEEVRLNRVLFGDKDPRTIESGKKLEKILKG